MFSRGGGAPCGKKYRRGSESRWDNYIVAQILDDSRLSPLEALGYNLIFLNTFDAGQSYTEQEHRAWLSEAGSVDIERAKFLLPDRHGLITARKPN